MTVNMGPSHPAMHGTVRIVLTVDGEKIVSGDVQPGYLHRCFEKEASTRRTRRSSRTPIASTTSRR
jgi:NADH:ubiquinone oxidoreductase subunit D